MQRILVVCTELHKSHVRRLWQFCDRLNWWKESEKKINSWIIIRYNVFAFSVRIIRWAIRYAIMMKHWKHRSIHGDRIAVKNSRKYYLNIVCTATIVLQSARLSSSAELDNSLLTTTTFSAKVIPARSRSSKLKNGKIFLWQCLVLVVYNFMLGTYQSMLPSIQ